MSESGATLILVHDPMCSWCWAFRPAWLRLKAALPKGVAVETWLGGLAPDSDEPMPADLQAKIAATWHYIESKVPGTQFNHAFWQTCAPRRSTWPACRAVIATARQSDHVDMTLAIQRAYYLGAQNPSDRETLVSLAGELGLDAAKFRYDLDSPAVVQELQRQITASRAIGGVSFPSLFLRYQDQSMPLPLDYRDESRVLHAIGMLLD